MSNYQCIVSKIERLIPIDKADNIQIAVVLGEYTIVSKSAEVGQLGLLFPAGTQLSEEYCKVNNLFRDKTKNSDIEKAGFFDENRKVRTQKFLGVKSEAYFTTLDSVAHTGQDLTKLKHGDMFDTIGEHKICNKFLSKTARSMKEGNSLPKTKKANAPFFMPHIETDQFKHNLHKINKGDLISIQAKGHGTSQRQSCALVHKRLPLWQEKVNRYFTIFKQKKVYEHVLGTRRVVLDSPDKVGFHGSEAWRYEIAAKLEPHVKEGITLYYEVVGYANNKPIMSKHNLAALKDKKYTKKYGDEIIYKYNCVEGTNDYYIYRITYTTNDGAVVDLTQQQLLRWCKDRGLNACLDVVEPFIYDGDEGKLKALVEELTERPELLTEDFRDPSIVSEGVVIRVENGNTTPLFLKSKSYLFRLLEGIVSEQEVDLEDIS